MSSAAATQEASKVCTRCRESVPLSGFYRSQKARDGRMSWCKECDKAKKRQWEKENRDTVNARRRRSRRRNPDTHRRAVAKYRAKHPERRAAIVAVYRAIKRGDLVRSSTCQQCGSDRHVEAHHADYNMPLEVRWLCSPCHNSADAERRERELEQVGGAK